MSHQDWAPVTWTKARPTGAKASDEKVVNQARRAGDDIETMKKFMGGQNKVTKSVCPNAAKLEHDTENLKHDKVSHTFAQALQKARLEKKLTQAQLAQLINEKASVINEYEGERAIPNGQVIAKLQRVLGSKLPAAKPKPKPSTDN